MNIQKLPVVLLFAIASMSITSCNETNKETTTAETSIDSTDTAPITTMQPTMNCYSGHIGKDSFNLRVEQFPTVVTGFLTYNFFEKDKNEGDLDGKIMGDTLLANYTYSSEGKTSTRQVIFLIKDSTAIEGYAEMQEQDGKMVFKNLHSVKFSGPKLKSVPCHTN